MLPKYPVCTTFTALPYYSTIPSLSDDIHQCIYGTWHMTGTQEVTDGWMESLAQVHLE